MEYQKFVKRLSLREFGVGCNPRWIHNLMKEYDIQAYNPRTGESPTALSLETEAILTGIKIGGDSNHHPNYPRIANTMNHQKPYGWKSVWYSKGQRRK